MIQRAKRCARLIEADEHYCDLTIRRWQAFASETANRLVALGDRTGQRPKLTMEEMGNLALL